MPDEVIPEADAIRFTYQWANDGTVGVVEGTRVVMTALPSTPLDPTDAPYEGFWCEVRDRNGTVLWQHVGRHPLAATVEAIGDADGWAEGDDDVGNGVFVVAVPAVAGATTVALMGSPGGRRGENAVELLTHSFGELP
jgi:hypothetical protein